MGKYPFKKLKNPTGICTLHNKDLNTQFIKRKKCVEKKCDYLKVNHDHPFWEQQAEQYYKKPISKILEETREMRVSLGTLFGDELLRLKENLD